MLPNVRSDLRRHCVHILQPAREVGHATRLLGQRLQNAPGMAALSLIFFGTKQQAHAVDGWAVEFLHAPDRLLKRGT